MFRIIRPKDGEPLVPPQTIQIIVFQTSAHTLGQTLKARTSTEAQRPFTVTYQERTRTCIFKSLTWCQEEAASGFVQAVAGKRCSADDDEAAEHHGHHADQHEDAPEAPVNCTWEAGSATCDTWAGWRQRRVGGAYWWPSRIQWSCASGERWGMGRGRRACTLWSRAGWLETHRKERQSARLLVCPPTCRWGDFLRVSSRLVSHVNMWNSTEPHKVPLSALEAATRLSAQSRRPKTRRTRNHLTLTRITSHGLSGHMRWPHKHTGFYGAKINCDFQERVWWCYSSQGESQKCLVSCSQWFELEFRTFSMLMSKDFKGLSISLALKIP